MPPPMPVIELLTQALSYRAIYPRMFMAASGHMDERIAACRREEPDLLFVSDRLRGEVNRWYRLDVGGDSASVETRTFDGTGWTRATRLTLTWGDR